MLSGSDSLGSGGTAGLDLGKPDLRRVRLGDQRQASHHPGVCELQAEGLPHERDDERAGLASGRS
jgi:hypothetical protein